jgi:hypothetical protein
VRAWLRRWIVSRLLLGRDRGRRVRGWVCGRRRPSQCRPRRLHRRRSRRRVRKMRWAWSLHESSRWCFCCSRVNCRCLLRAYYDIRLIKTCYYRCLSLSKADATRITKSVPGVLPFAVQDYATGAIQAPSRCLLQCCLRVYLNIIFNPSERTQKQAMVATIIVPSNCWDERVR